MNPYKILGANPNMTQRDILQAAALAMRTKLYSAQEIAIAQKELMNPITKASHDFIHFIEVPISCDEFLERPYCEISSPTDLKRLSCFDKKI